MTPILRYGFRPFFQLDGRARISALDGKPG